jgi:hypothetical protein
MLIVTYSTVHTRNRRRLKGDNTESLRLKSDLEKDLAAAVYLSEPPPPP